MNTCTAIRLAARRAPMVVTGALLLMPATAAAQDAAKAEAGEQVYSTYCSTCHGDRLVSTGQTFDLRRLTAAVPPPPPPGGAPPALRELRAQRQEPDATLAWRAQRDRDRSDLALHPLGERQEVTASRV
jgi:hypothetical protein